MKTLRKSDQTGKRGWARSFIILLVAFTLQTLFVLGQTPTVTDLQASGTGILWYLTATGGTSLDPSTPLVDGQHYFASQTVDGCESSSRLEVTVALNPQDAPGESAHVPFATEVVWNWTAAGAAAGYKWNTTDDYGSATDLATALSYTETELSCNTAYTRYIWAYNETGCHSHATTLTQTTSECPVPPMVSTGPAGSIGADSAALVGEVFSSEGEPIIVRGFKYSMTMGFDPVTSGTNISESGTFSSGSYTLNASGLSTNTQYYFIAYAVSTPDTSYGNEQTFETQEQLYFEYTGDVQSFIVPEEVDTIIIQAWGAEGGVDGNPGTGGLGGYAKGTLVVTPESEIFIFVGGQGESGGDSDRNNAGGWNGGGSGGFDNSDQTRNGGGGGGASDVRYGGSALSDRILVAGGGGGSANRVYGGNGGGFSGLNGSSGNTNSGGGGGGTQVSGGTVTTTLRGATDGTFGQGGNGSTDQNAWGSGGGGGGYYGGAGGTSTANHNAGYAAGGGGGSSYVGGVSGGTTTTGVRHGNGLIIISYKNPEN